MEMWDSLFSWVCCQPFHSWCFRQSSSLEEVWEVEAQISSWNLAYIILQWFTYITVCTAVNEESQSRDTGFMICSIQLIKKRYLYSFFCSSSPFTFMSFCYCWCCSVAQLCPTLCNPMDCSTPGLPVPHHLPEFVQVHVHCISDAVQPSHPLTPSSPSALDLSQHWELFQWVICAHQMTSIDQNTRASALASVFPVNIQGWSPLRLTGLISLLSKGLSGVFSNTTVWRHQFFGILPFLRFSTHNCMWPLGRP